MHNSFAKEMGNALPERPLIFMKPTHSIRKMNGDPLSFQGSKGELNCEAEIVLHVGRLYEKGMDVNDLINEMTIGLDFTYRDILNTVKKKGQPWLPSKGFPNSAAVGNFVPFSSELVEHQDFRLAVNGELLQIGAVKNMIFSLQTLVDFVGENFGLGKGDLIYTGTPEGIGTLKNGDQIEVYWGRELVGFSQIVMNN